MGSIGDFFYLALEIGVALILAQNSWLVWWDFSQSIKAHALLIVLKINN
jgi:hypothetical protein